ncbi:MAG: hypothetical protein AAF716_23105 [Cyanobacteria bacterium P01_D01_bin.1]
MAYGNFTIEQLIETFDLSIKESSGLFAEVPSATGSAYLTDTLRENVELAVAISTEKARSELIIMPVLLDLKRHFNTQVSLFSGIDFTVAPEHGLNGVCDFLVSRSVEQILVRSPVIMLVEAKNENLKIGFPQCIAEMVAAQLFNQQKGNPIEVVYGVVTIGTLWRFLRLSGSVVEIDLSEYHISNIEKILGILASALM